MKYNIKVLHLINFVELLTHLVNILPDVALCQLSNIFFGIQVVNALLVLLDIDQIVKAKRPKGSWLLCSMGRLCMRAAAALDAESEFTVPLFAPRLGSGHGVAALLFGKWDYHHI